MSVEQLANVSTMRTFLQHKNGYFVCDLQNQFVTGFGIFSIFCPRYSIIVEPSVPRIENVENVENVWKKTWKMRLQLQLAYQKRKSINRHSKFLK